jgi:hypothetical protein
MLSLQSNWRAGVAEGPRIPREPGIPKARQAKRDPMGKQALFWLPHESEPPRAKRSNRSGSKGRQGSGVSTGPKGNTRPVGAGVTAGARAPGESRAGGSLLSVVRELLTDMAGIKVRGKCERCGDTWTQDPLRFLFTRGLRCTISNRGLTPKGDCSSCGAKGAVSFSLVPGSTQSG